MILLLHPTHRKFIKLLRNKVNNGDVIYIPKKTKASGNPFLTHRKIQKKAPRNI